MKLSYKEFVSFYEKYKYCINDINKLSRKKKLLEKQLIAKYNKYIKSLEKSLVKKKNSILNKKKVISQQTLTKMEKWKNVCKEVDKRDKGKCRLIECLDYDEFQELKKNSGPFRKIKDHAHIFKRSGYPSLIYDKNNIITLNRYSHSMLDQNRSPIDGSCISKDKVTYWWERIVGKAFYVSLRQKTTKSNKLP